MKLINSLSKLLLSKTIEAINSNEESERNSQFIRFEGFKKNKRIVEELIDEINAYNKNGKDITKNGKIKYVGPEKDKLNDNKEYIIVITRLNRKGAVKTINVYDQEKVSSSFMRNITFMGRARRGPFIH